MTASSETATTDRELPSLELRLNRLLTGDFRLKIAAAESCTGGLVGHRITSIAGSSDYFQGSVVTYSNEAKMALLGVPEAILSSVGAVSAECARAMAEGARRIFAADLAVSTTGIAGPGGATARKPVGLVYIGLSTAGESKVEEHHFAGDRTAVIAAAAERALELVLSAVESASCQT
jgi:PncC family amidohydrolase